ncbi:hypothetical protein CHCC5027_3880 [Bacillus paralicheniformis]|nr:hypothetical protein CHCC5027_3880 [Bacillus paralicheniformis]
MKNIRNSMQAGTDAGSVSPENDNAYIFAVTHERKIQHSTHQSGFCQKRILI